MCMCFLLFFFWVSSMVKVHGKHPVRIVAVFLIGLHASARMTACCACLGVGVIVIPFFVFLRMQDVASTSNIARLLWQARRADQDSFFKLPPLGSQLNSCDLQDKSGHHE